MVNLSICKREFKSSNDTKNLNLDNLNATLDDAATHGALFQRRLTIDTAAKMATGEEEDFYLERKGRTLLVNHL